jgi:protein-tyrosine sulfotransferase
MLFGRATGLLPARYRGRAGRMPGPGGVWHSADMSHLPGLDHANGSAAVPDPCRSPVFILTGSRSGSTLLRFILDSHPDLACPPETGISSACVQLARAWDVLDNAGRAPGDDTAGSSPVALAAVRDSMDHAFGSYLQRRGKRRWCDKSLDNHLNAELLAELYPEAKFICLYRHCMDVVASAVETCPWGLHRYGLDPYVAQNPGNSVAAVGSYWMGTVQSILKFEEKHPESCHRVRYEDLVTAPEETAAGIFSFLGADQVPGITRECLSAPHDSNGPGDDKIWFTDKVTSDSIGRGVGVPAAGLHKALRDTINETLAKLEYRTVGDDWNATVGHVDPRADGAAPAPASGDRASGRPAADMAIGMIGDRIGLRSADELREISARWPGLAGQTLTLVVQEADGEHAELSCRFGAAQEGVSFPAASDGDGPADDDGTPVATLIASSSTWRALLGGETNVIAEMTAGRLRCVNRRDAHRLRTDEIHAVAALLGLTRLTPRPVNEAGPERSAGDLRVAG